MAACPVFMNMRMLLMNLPRRLPFFFTMQSELQRWAPTSSDDRVTLQAVQWLTRPPDRFSAAQLTPLIGSGSLAREGHQPANPDAFYGWLDRLRVALGEEE